MALFGQLHVQIIALLSEIFVQDGTCRTLAYLRHQSSLCIIRMFPRHLKWELQRLKLTNKEKYFQSEAIGRKDRYIQELFGSTLN